MWYMYLLPMMMFLMTYLRVTYDLPVSILRLNLAFICYRILLPKEEYLVIVITKTCLFKYTENFTCKNENIQIKHSDIFHISAQNIDCGYSLEPPQ